MQVDSRFTEDWFSEVACDALAHLAGRTNHLAGRVVEIGCWEGKSTCVLANAVAPTIVDAVDTWEGSPGEISSTLARERDIYSTFIQNVTALTAGNVAVHPMDWRDYTDRTPIRFCHIDATHTYEEVADNIRAIWPLIVEGGILCGDDAHHKPVARAVFDTLGTNVNVSGPLWWYEKRGEMVELASRTLTERYREACQTPSDIYEHLPVFVDLCRELNATKIIELGTRGAVSTLAWLYGLEGHGELWSVDIDPAPAIPFVDHWTFVLGSDLDPAVARQLPNDADVVFIDTSHMYQQTLAELNVYKYKIRPGGCFVLHDTELRRPIGWTSDQPEFPVKSAVEEFCGEEGLTYSNRPNCFGLARIDMPGG